MPYTDEGKAIALRAIAERAPYLSIHTFKYASRENELPVGLYERQRISFDGPKEGELRADTLLRFEIPHGSRCESAGFWGSVSGGDMVAYAKFVRPIQYRGRGVLVVDLATLDLNLDSDLE